MIFNVAVQKFCFSGHLFFSNVNAAGYLEKQSIAARKFTSFSLFVIEGSTKINVCFLVRFGTGYMRNELFGGNYRFKILNDCCAMFALCRLDNKIPIHIWAPAMCSHIYHAPVTRIVSVFVGSRGLSQGVLDKGFLTMQKHLVRTSKIRQLE